MSRKVLRTRLCDLLNIEYPIIQAGMGTLPMVGTVASVELVAAVSNAGGMGILGGAGMEGDELRDQIREIRSLTDKPFGVDLVFPSVDPSAVEAHSFADLVAEIPKRYPEQVAFVNKLKKEFEIPEVEVDAGRLFLPEQSREELETVLEEKVPVIVFALGTPEWAVSEAHARGMKVLSLVGNAKQAHRVVAAGVDAVITTGYEAGGHTGKIANMALVPEVVDAIYPTPVILGGSVVDGRGIVAALALGAVGVWVGTRFEATYESGLSDGPKQRLAQASTEHSLYTKALTGKTARLLTTPFYEAWEKSGIPTLPNPLQTALIYDSLAGMEASDRVDLKFAGAGQAVGMIKEIKSAKEVVDEMVEEAVSILKKKFPAEVIVGE